MKRKIFSVFSKKTYLILLVIVLIGSYLRLSGVFSNSFAFTYDVGRDMLALWNLVHTHKLLLIGFTTGLPGVFYGPWWYYLLLLPYVISLGNPQGIALTMGLIGVLTIILGFVLGKKIGGEFLGIAFASFIAVSPPLISLSSQIWNPNITPMFIILSLLILHKIYLEEKPKARYYLILGFFIALVIDLEIVFGSLLAIGLILALLIVKNKKNQIKSLFALSVGGMIIFAPRIIFEIRHQFLMTTSFIKFLVVSDPSSHKLNLIGTFMNRWTMLFDQFNATIALENKFLGVIIILFMVITVALFYKKTSDTSKKFIKTSSIILLTFLIGLTFFHHDIFDHYLVGLPVIYLLLLCLIVSLTMQKTRNYIIPGLIIFAVFWINLNPILIINSVNKPLFVGDVSVYRNKLAAIDYVYQQSKGRRFKYVIYTRAVYDDVYQYLFRWYGQNKYHYLPSKSANLAYFILEQDPQYPFDLNDWLKLREKDGKIIKTERFKSGIVIQTRVN